MEIEIDVESIKKEVTVLVIGFALDNRLALSAMFKEFHDGDEDLTIAKLLVDLTDYELASMIAYMLKDSIPKDDELEGFAVMKCLMTVLIPWAKTIDMDYLRSIQYDIKEGEKLLDQYGI